MTAAQLTAMQAGKREADAARRVEHAEQLVVYKAWVKAEATAHLFMANTEQLHGLGSDEHDAARAVWRDTWRNRPISPPDSAWQAHRDS